MTDQMRPTSYHRVAKALHWLIAVLIIAQFVGGKFMTHLGLGTDEKFFVYQMHKSFGFIILGLSLYRLYWRLTHPVPALPTGMSKAEQVIAPITHWLFYGFMIAVPLTGWLYVSAQSGVDTKIFFLIPVFHFPVPESDFWRGAFDNAHSALATAMIGLLVLHVAAALKHHYMSRDETFLRMLPAKEAATGRIAVPAITGALVAVAALYLVVMLVWGEDDHHGSTPTDEMTAIEQIGRTSGGPHEWSLLPEESYVQLTGSAFGAEKTVHIDDVAAEIVLDLEHPEEAGAIRAQIGLTSLDSGEAITNDELKGAGWFSVAEYPAAMFVSDEIIATAQGFVAKGMLTIREVSQPIDLPFTVTMEGVTAIASAEVVVDRTAFGLGGDGAGVTPQVTVTLHIEAEPAR
ncbi:cytochrome b/b6 domain-containing protein [Parvularcula marina]|uniref:cytochrome b/b6 domain-containing protein n=2 Tax=Parvularcula marina TaxID=2292771 RepID=UPI003511CE83